MSSYKKLVSYLRQDAFTPVDLDSISNILKLSVENLKIDTIKQYLVKHITSTISIDDKKTEQNTLKKLSIQEIINISDIYCKQYIWKSTIILKPYRTIKQNNKSLLLYMYFNKDQRRIFDKIHEVLSSSLNISSNKIDSPKLIMLDSPPGTGKSFIVTCLGLTIDNPITAIVKTRQLALTFSNAPNISSMTTCKFQMTLFQTPFNEAIKLFKDTDTFENLLYKLYDLVNKSYFMPNKLLIIDEYSMESPIFLAIMVLLSYKLKFNMLILGDKNQQNTLEPSKFHKCSNYELLSNLNATKLFLYEQMRIIDKEYLYKVELIQNLITSFKSSVKGDTYNNLFFKYFIYTNFRSVFFTSDDLIKNIYLSDKHEKLKNRYVKILKYCTSKNILHKCESYTVQDTKLELPTDYKFLPYLLLVKGMTYIYSQSGCENCFVEILDIKDNYVLAKNTSKDQQYYIKKVVWSKFSHPCVDEQFMWLSSFTDEYIVQYPLKPCIFTYHKIQGLTFSNNEALSLDLDCPSINAFYVAMTRVTHSTQIKSIYSKDTLSLIYTEYKSDDYLYHLTRIPLIIMNELEKYVKNPKYTFDDSQMYENICTFTDIDLFARSRIALKRIPKKLYQLEDITQKHSTKSELTIIVQFLLEHSTDKIINRIDLLSKYIQYKDDITNAENGESNSKRICRR